MTRRGYVAAALAALVLLVVPLGLVPVIMAHEQEPAVAEPVPTPASIRGDREVAATMTCDDSATPATEVPDGVVAALMCATDAGVLPWYAPQDALHADLGPVVDLLAGLEPVPRSTEGERTFCADVGGVGFDLRLVLATGEVVSVRGDTGGCGTVRLGGDELVGAGEVLDVFLASITAQRAATTPAADLEELALACGSDGPLADHVLSRIGDPRDLVRAVSCSRRDTGVDVPPWRGPTRVPTADVAILTADMENHSRNDLGWDDLPCGERRTDWQDLVGQTRWGDVVAVRGVCDTYLLSDATLVAPEHHVFWHPSPAAQRVLDRLRH